MCVAVAETSSLGGQVVKVLKLPRLPRRVGVNVNYRRLFPRVFSGTGFLGCPLLLVITWLKLTVAFFSHWFFLLLLWSSTVLKYNGTQWYGFVRQVLVLQVEMWEILNLNCGERCTGTFHLRWSFMAQLQVLVDLVGLFLLNTMSASAYTLKKFGLGNIFCLFVHSSSPSVIRVIHSCFQE